MTNMDTTLSRRGFVAGAVVAGTSVAAASISQQARAEEESSWLPQKWDEEANIVIVGCGAAALSAAIQANIDGDEDVLVLEAAPEQYAGGNTRVSGGLVFIPDTPEDALAYQQALNCEYKVDEDILKAWAQGVCGNMEWLTNEMGLDMVPSGFSSPEFPGLPGGEHVVTYIVNGTGGGSGLWQPLYDDAIARGTRMLFDARVTELIFEPSTREVYGVRSEDGRTFKARKGVVLALGGFTNNQGMIQDYFCGGGASKVLVIGSPYNRGDGITMAQQIGARLWHMNNYAGSGVGVLGTNDWTNNATAFSTSLKDFIYVDPEGKRFMREEDTDLNRHGRIKKDGAWPVLSVPTTSYMIFGSDTFNSREMLFNGITYMTWTGFMDTIPAKTNQEMVEQGLLVTADTIEELAEKIGLPAEDLANTVNTYNENAAANIDPDFNRGQAIYSNYFYNPNAGTTDSAENAEEEIVAVEAFDLQPINPPFYAMEIRAQFMNTQGGAKRNGNSEVLNFKNEPIPRLYSAGEFGAVYPYMYNGGGNISDAIYSGRVAGGNVAALEPWE